MTTEIKIGDKVRLKDDWSPYRRSSDPEVGTVAIVTRVINNYPINYICVDATANTVWSAEWWEVVTEEQPETGLRFNDGKAMWHLLPWNAVTEVVSVLTKGATKYAPRNWEKGLSYQETFASLQRHATKWFAGEDRDPESEELHMTHVATNALFLVFFHLTGRGTDDRPKKV